MITTGWPEASLLATCGSEPIDLEPPFGGKQGTRLKMSPADFATSFTLSMVLPAMPFCCAGFAGSTAAILPSPFGLAASSLLAGSGFFLDSAFLSDSALALVLSDSAA